MAKGCPHSNRTPLTGRIKRTTRHTRNGNRLRSRRTEVQTACPLSRVRPASVTAAFCSPTLLATRCESATSPRRIGGGGPKVTGLMHDELVNVWLVALRPTSMINSGPPPPHRSVFWASKAGLRGYLPRAESIALDEGKCRTNSRPCRAWVRGDRGAGAARIFEANPVSEPIR